VAVGGAHRSPSLGSGLSPPPSEPRICPCAELRPTAVTIMRP